MCKRNDFYFRNVLWNLHIIAQLRAQNLRDVPAFQPDSLAFVKKWKLPLSTVPKNYIWNQSSLIAQSLKNMHIFFRSYLSPKRVDWVLKKTVLMCPKWRKLLKGHPKLVIRNRPPAWRAKQSKAEQSRAKAPNTVVKARTHERVSYESIQPDLADEELHRPTHCDLKACFFLPTHLSLFFVLLINPLVLPQCHKHPLCKNSLNTVPLSIYWSYKL